MKTLAVSVCFIAVVAGSGLVAASQGRPAPNPLAAAKSLTCSFPVFAAARWGETAEPINGTQDFSFRIENIDFRRGRATVVGSGTVPVTVRLAETGLNVIEQTPIGNFILTTVFTAGAKGATYRAAHSRHIGEVADAPRTSQSYGSCDLQ